MQMTELRTENDSTTMATTEEQRTSLASSSRDLTILMPHESSHLVSADHRDVGSYVKTDTSDTVKCIFTSFIFVVLVVGILYITFVINPQM